MNPIAWAKLLCQESSRQEEARALGCAICPFGDRITVLESGCFVVLVFENTVTWPQLALKYQFKDIPTWSFSYQTRTYLQKSPNKESHVKYLFGTLLLWSFSLLTVISASALWYSHPVDYTCLGIPLASCHSFLPWFPATSLKFFIFFSEKTFLLSIIIKQKML